MADIHVTTPLCIAAGAIFPPVCAIVVGLRFYGRRRQKADLGADDWLTLPTLAMLIPLCVILLIGVEKKVIGYESPDPGTPEYDDKAHKQSLAKHITYFVELLLPLALLPLKMSLVFFYRRLFMMGSGPWLKYGTLCILILTAIWALAYFFVWVAYCPGHTSAFWTTLPTEMKYCVNTMQVHYSFGITDVFLDLVIFVIPIWPVVHLQMTLKRKAAVLSVFGIGAFALVASILRMVAIIESVTAQFEPDFDVQVLVTGGCYWATVEVGVALITACLPTVNSAFRPHLIKRVRSSRSLGHSNHPFSSLANRASVYRKQHDSEDAQTDSSQIELTELSTKSYADGGPALDEGLVPDPNRITVVRTVETFETAVKRGEDAHMGD